VSDLDGHYKHAGVTIEWNEKRLKLARKGASQRIKWRHVDGVRRLGPLPGHVQLIVDGRVPPGDPERDPLSIPVASEADANRLVTVFTWLAASRQAS
jgi:hypothetical protein